MAASDPVPPLVLTSVPARNVAVDLVLAIDPANPEPLHRQLYRALRTAILDQRVKPGAKLPSTRAMSAALGVARNTVHGAFDQLLAEGYLEARHGSGTYVAASLPDDALRAQPATVSGLRQALSDLPRAVSDRHSSAPRAPSLRLSRWGQRVARIEQTPYLGAPVTLPYDFRHGRPDATNFPLEAWRRIAGRQLRQLDRDDIWYGPAAGLPALRAAIAEYLTRARGLRCVAEQVIVTTGTQQAIDLLARLLVEADDTVVVEDPCYPGARRVFDAQGARLVDAPVDEHGLCTELLPDEPARLVYTTPSHQYPSGATLPVSRRLDLLRWAERHDAVIVEDDYDSEFRHAGRPLEALQGLDRTLAASQRSCTRPSDWDIWSRRWSWSRWPRRRSGWWICRQPRRARSCSPS
jgi:GntR family transcriptional regulator / MocR family aminotransferase